MYSQFIRGWYRFALNCRMGGNQMVTQRDYYNRIAFIDYQTAPCSSVYLQLFSFNFVSVWFVWYTKPATRQILLHVNYAAGYRIVSYRIVSYDQIYRAHWSIFYSVSLIFSLDPCSNLSWLSVSIPCLAKTRTKY